MAARKSTAEVAEVEANNKAVAEMNRLSHSNRQYEVAQVTSLAEIRSLFGVEERSWDEIEPSFDVVEQKEFEGVPLVIGAFRFHESKKFMKQIIGADGEEHLVPAEFVSLLVAGYDKENETFVTPWCIVNDGGAGIKAQMERYAAQYGDDPRNAPPLRVSKGLRASEYDYDDGKSVSRATTWYLG